MPLLLSALDLPTNYGRVPLVAISSPGPSGRQGKSGLLSWQGDSSPAAVRRLGWPFVAIRSFVENIAKLAHCGLLESRSIGAYRAQYRNFDACRLVEGRDFDEITVYAKFEKDVRRVDRIRALSPPRHM